MPPTYYCGPGADLVSIADVVTIDIIWASSADVVTIDIIAASIYNIAANTITGMVMMTMVITMMGVANTVTGIVCTMAGTAGVS